jgi:hypothetical protein
METSTETIDYCLKGFMADQEHKITLSGRNLQKRCLDFTQILNHSQQQIKRKIYDWYQ